MLDPRRLRLLVEFDRRGTVGAVAAALSYTPSAVSQQLATLEREAGVPLFEHVGRRMILTEMARVLVAHSGEVLAAIERAEADLEGASGELRGILRLAGISSVGMALVPQALVALEQRHPGLTIEYQEAETEEALGWLDVGEVDLVVGTRHEATSVSRHYERLLCRDPLSIALPRDHPLASRRAVDLRQLAAEHWVSARVGTAYDEMLLRACRRIGRFEPDIRHRSDSYEVVMGLVAAGSVALIHSLGSPEAHERIVVRPVSGARLRREIFTAARLPHSRRPAIAAVRDALQDAWERRNSAA